MPPAQGSALNPDCAIADTPQKGAVVADQHHGPAPRQQHVFHPGDGRQVEVVGGFIHQQHIRFLDQRTGEGNAPRFPSRQPVRQHARVQLEPGQHGLGTVGLGNEITITAGAMHDNAGKAHPPGQFRGLGQIGNADTRRRPERAFIGLAQACHQFHEG